MSRRSVFWTVAAAAAALAVAWSWSLRWTCDDAFISLRYVGDAAETWSFVWGCALHGATVLWLAGWAFRVGAALPVAADLAGFRDFCFDHNDDPARLRAFEEYLQQQ